MSISIDDIVIRPICKEDNAAIAALIRNTLTEFGANKPGTVYFDPTTDHLFELFRKESSMYNIACFGDRIVGGAGIYPTEGLPDATCELVKMYLAPDVRGKGLGKKLISLCMEAARNMGYQQIYLESMPELKRALNVYEKIGFEYLPGPLGNSGHCGCGLWMMKKI